jgi:putative two-component system response regulator
MVGDGCDLLKVGPAPSETCQRRRDETVMQTPRPTDARILVVDDERINVVLLERILEQAGYTQVRSTTNSAEAAALYDEFEPDLILLDLHMPGLDGFAVMEQLEGRISSDGFLPILILTADIRPEVKRRALAAGAKDFVTKPFDRTEVLLRIQNLLETRFLYLRSDRHPVAEGKAT